MITSVWAQALLYGSLWGMAEATAGHALHLARVPGLAGFIMFPLGFILMSLAFRRTGRNVLAVLMTSWVAAGIKLVDLLLPGTDFLAVWNPAQAILLEGLAAGGLILVLRKARATVARAAIASLCWRMAYLALGFLCFELFGAGNLVQTQPAFLLRFLLLDSLANGSLIYFLLRLGPLRMPLFAPDAKISKLLSRPDETKATALNQPALAVILLVAALSLELVL